MQPPEDQDRRPPEPQGEKASPVAVVSSRDLFEGCREIVIDHDGVYYRLRITRKNRLVLIR